MTATSDSVLADIRRCKVCEAHLPYPPRPVLQAGATFYDPSLAALISIGLCYPGAANGFVVQPAVGRGRCVRDDVSVGSIATTVAHLVRCVGIGTVVNSLHVLSASGEGDVVSPSHKTCATNPSVVRGGRFTFDRIGAAYSVSAQPRLRPDSASQRIVALGHVWNHAAQHYSITPSAVGAGQD